jgi:hypothetical protein
LPHTAGRFPPPLCLSCNAKKKKKKEEEEEEEEEEEK